MQMIMDGGGVDDDDECSKFKEIPGIVTGPGRNRRKNTKVMK